VKGRSPSRCMSIVRQIVPATTTRYDDDVNGG